MSLPGLENIMSSWFGFTGDYTLIAMGILVFFVLALVLVGIDIKFALMFCLPLAAVFTSSGWFSTGFSIVFWFISVGAAGFILWTSISER